MKRAVWLALLGIGWGCGSGLDEQREPVDTGTFGETVVTLACKRVAYLEDLADGDGVVDVRGDEFRDVCRLGLAPPEDAPDTLKALQAKRDTLVSAVDTIFPEEFLADLQGYLTTNEFLATYDEGTAIAAVDGLIGFLQLAGNDQAMTESLERLGHRLGYVPVDEALGAVRTVVNYPELHQFLLTFIDEIAVGGGSRETFEDLIAAASLELQELEVSADPSDPERTGRLALDLLFTERALLGTEQDIPLVVRDYRGVARVDALAAPFADGDGDGLADIDTIGRYVDEQGQLAVVPAPFELPEGEDQIPWDFRDDRGRPLTADGGPLVYQYVNLDRTVFAALARDAVDLFDPQKGTALDLMRGGSALMGARQMVEKTYASGTTLAYRGYDVSSSPLLDMLFGYLQVLRDPGIYDTLALARNLLVEREAEMARLLEAVIEVARLGDQFPDAALAASSPMWDDMLPLLQQIVATPGLAEDLIRAMEDPAVKALGPLMAKHMTHTDQFGYGPEDENNDGYFPLVGEFQTQVDRSLADSNFNRSLWQRLLHLIADSNGAPLCNEEFLIIGRCELIDIDNVAVFYTQSIVGKADLGSTYETLTDLLNLHPIDGLNRYPTPEALGRTLFLEDPPEIIATLMGEPSCKEGHLYKTGHGGTLPVWEKDGFFDAIRPVVQAFADHDAEQIFVDVLTVMHEHWPSEDSINHQTADRDSPDYAFGSNGVSYEPLLAAAFADTDLIPALADVSPALNATTANGKAMPTIVASAARYLVTPQPGLKNRAGADYSETADGRPIIALSPYQILADAYALKRERLEAAGPEGAAWSSAVSGVVDVLLRGDLVANQGYRLRNPRMRGVSVALIDFLTARLAAHDLAGDRDAWLTEELPASIEEVTAGPMFAATADFALNLQASPEARAELEKLLAYLVDETRSSESFRTNLTALADLMQLALDDRDLVPIARVVGQAIEPERGWLDAQIAFVQAARRADQNQALVRIMRNLYDENRRGRTAVGDLIDGISEVKRARPWEDLGARYTAADYAALLHGVADFLDEKKRGLRKFISIIESRNL